MSPTDIVCGIHVRTQKQLLPNVPKRWLPQFWFGLQAYGLRAFQSANGNARMVMSNANTAARKSERLLANVGLAEHLATVFDSFGLVKRAAS